MRGHETGEQKERRGHMLRSSIGQAAIMAFAALVHTAWEDHREKTHHAIEIKPWMKWMMKISGAAFTDTNRWAAVHRKHHSTPDANLHPFVQFVDLVEWLNDHPEVDADLPETVKGLDPAAYEISFEDAVEIGSTARKLVDGLYAPQQEYASEEIQLILHGEEPRYFYEEGAGNKDNAPTLGEEPSLHDVRFLLRDPHSPALHRDGMRGIAVHNRKLYEDVVWFYRRNPQLMPEDIVESSQEVWIEDHKKQVRWAMVGANVLARLALERPNTVSGLARSAIRGAAAAGLGTLGLIAGGNIVNSLGHGGEVKFASVEFWKDIFDGKVRPKSNGTYETNNLWLSPQTLGEVGGQQNHHGDPSLIAYVDGGGYMPEPKKWIVDPFGMATKFLAEHALGMTVGKGFPGQPRPDEPSDAVKRLEEVRRWYIARHPSASTE